MVLGTRASSMSSKIQHVLSYLCQGKERTTTDGVFSCWQIATSDETKSRQKH